MDIPLLADKTGEIAKAYGVYKVQLRLQSFSINTFIGLSLMFFIILSKDDSGIAYRGLFIIDGKQNLRQITINDLPVGRSVDETLRLVQAFQFTDKYGEGTKN